MAQDLFLLLNQRIKREGESRSNKPGLILEKGVIL